MAGIYIHIPFCQRRCIYCDFFSTTQSEQKPTYIQALCQELEIRKDYLEDEEIETIYLGGGTPSQLSKEELEAIFRTLYHIYKVKENAEITLEANPDDLTPEYGDTDLPGRHFKTTSPPAHCPASHRSLQPMPRSRLPEHQH